MSKWEILAGYRKVNVVGKVHISERAKAVFGLNEEAGEHLNTESGISCPVCGSKQLKPFFEAPNVPVFCCVFWPSREAALNCPRGDIKLTFCSVCSYIMNQAFEPDRLEYSQAYENSLHFSPFFQDYAQSLAQRLVERYHLYDKSIISIGAGKGEFLLMLCEIGNNHGMGLTHPM